MVKNSGRIKAPFLWINICFTNHFDIKKYPFLMSRILGTIHTKWFVYKFCADEIPFLIREAAILTASSLGIILFDLTHFTYAKYPV